MVWDVTVRDALGFTFAFTYTAATRAGAVAEFRRRARRNGVRKFRNIKVLAVEPSHRTK